MAEPGRTPARQYLEAMMAGRASLPPFMAALQMRLTDVSDGGTTIEMPASDELYNADDVVDGGALVSLMETAMGLAIVSTLAEGETYTTGQLSVTFVRSVTSEGGPLRATARVTHRGPQAAAAEAECVDAQRQVVASATATSTIVTPAARAVNRAPTLMVASQPTAALPFAAMKERVRLFTGDMAYVRRGQGLPVVLLHGIPSSSYLWRDVIDPLAQRFDVIAPDLVGYGDSEKRLDTDLSIAAQARYVVALLEALKVRQAAVIGHDIGAGIAQLIATDEPALVARLALIDSIVDNNWPIPDIARLRDPAWDQIMVNLDLRGGFRKGLEAGLVVPGRMTDEVLDEWVRPFADQDGRRGYLRAARALNNRDLVSRSRHIEEIAAPTLILWGAQDRFLDAAWAAHLQRKIRGSTLELIDPGGHFLPLDRPDAVIAALLRFLSS